MTPKEVFLLMITAMIFSCSISKDSRSNLKSTSIEENNDSLEIFEREVLASCPVSKGPGEVVKYLENLEGFYRNKEFDFGNGSIRFNSKNAQIYGIDLMDNKSLFLLNFDINDESYSGWSLFQAIYFYNNLSDKENELTRIMNVINEELSLGESTHYDILKNPYARYTLPDGSKFNLKHGSSNDRYVIDIIWAPN